MQKELQFHDTLLKIMRITLTQILLLVIFMGVSWANKITAQEILNKRLTLTVEEQPIRVVLAQIENATEIRFLYSSNIIKAARNVSLSVSNKPLSEILPMLLTPLHVEYNVIGKQIILKRSEQRTESLPNDESSAAAEQQVSGKVTDEKGEDMIGVTVAVKGTTKGTTTDVNGKFSLTVPDANSILVFSFIGYKSKEVIVGNQTSIQIAMSAETSALEEVVVVGYGTVKKSDLTGSVSSINSTELKKTQLTSLDQGLQGRASGVQVTQSNGQPGGGISIRVRGGNSITGNNEPLYVIDGFPVFNDQNLNAGVNLGAATNPLSTINPNDIESIEVLKDASATAIYGARGANGVVMITTKRGKSGNAKIDYETYVGSQQVVKMLPLLNAQQYAQLINDARVNGGLQPYFTTTQVDSLGRVGGTDWQKEIFQTALMHSHQLTISGGTDKLQYAVSGNYLNQDGIIINSGFNRGNIRLNLDSKVNNFLKIGVNTLISQTNNKIVPTEGTGVTNPGVIWSAHLYSPLQPVYDATGNYNYRNIEPALGNPVAYASLINNKNTSNRVLANLFAEFTLAKDLILKINGGQDLTTTKESLYIPGSIYIGETTKGFASVGNVSVKSKLLENTLSYQKNINQTHNLSALLGYTIQNLRTELSRASSQNFPNDIIGYNDLSFGTTYLAPASQINESKIVSYLGRLNYGYKGRYLFTGTLRIDGSTRFGTGNKYGTFPSGSFAWRAIEEPFMKSVENIVNDLKIRVSYGLTGNQEIGLYRSLPLLSNYATAFGNALNIGIAPSNIPNPGLKWETTAQSDIGIDAALWGNRVQLSADYYVKNTRDLLLNVTLPLTSGYASTLKNIGKVKNRGWEFSITTVNIDKALRWTTTLNLASNKNKVVDLGGISQFFVGQTVMTVSTQGVVKVGEPVGTFFGRITDGIFQNQAEVDASAQKTAKPGDRRYKDLNNDGIINDNDRTIIGNSQAKFFGGITNNFSYKGFDLSVFFNGVFGNKILNVNKFRLYTLGSGATGTPAATGNNSTDVLNRWSTTNPSTTVPRANTTYPGDILSDFQIEDGSFLRLKNVSLGYNFNPTLISKLKMRSLKMYVSGQNLLTFTNYTGYDPEVSRFGQNATLAGIDYGGYPISKTFTVGLNIGF